MIPIKLLLHINSPKEKVFKALTESSELSKWYTTIVNGKFKLDEIELSSEKIIYSELLNEIQAEGNVFLKDENGDFHNGENLIINNKT